MTKTIMAFPILQQQHQKHSRRLSPSRVTSISFSTRKVRCAVIPNPYFAENGDNNTNNDNNESTKIRPGTTMDDNNNDIGTSPNTGTSTMSSMSSTTTTTPLLENNNKSIIEMLDELAQQLKLAALQANAKAAIYPTKEFVLTKYRYYLQACMYYTLFLSYRAYRGFFVILPAVFRETFRKLQYAIDDSPFGSSDDNNYNLTSGTTTTTENDVSFSTESGVLSSTTSKPLTIRTRITISILSMFVLCAYVLGGAVRVTTSFFKSIRNGSTLVQSLQTAIQIQERNEQSLLYKSNQNQNRAASTIATTTATTASIINGSNTQSSSSSFSLPEIDTTKNSNDQNPLAP